MNEQQAKQLIERLMPLQENPGPEGFQYPCPRCGHERMDANPVRNALSRRAKVYICDQCGTDEALLDITGRPPLPLNQWAMVLGTDEAPGQGETAVTEEEAKKMATERVFVDMNWPDIVEACERRGIPVTKKRPMMEQALIEAMTKEYLGEAGNQ